MTSYNKVIQLGNLTKDPELVGNDGSIAKFGIAVNRKWTGKDGQQHEEVCYTDCQAFGKTGAIIAQYLHKGDPVLIEGRLVLEKWESQDGSKRSKHSITIERFSFVGGGPQQQQAPAADAPPIPAWNDSDIPF